jgi:hypothetical protein
MTLLYTDPNAQNVMRVACMLAIVSAILTPALAQTYIGASACGRCNPAEFRQQSSSEHAHSLYPANQHPLAAQFVPHAPLHRDPSYELPMLKMEILDKIDVAVPKHGGFLFETTKVEVDAAVFRGSRRDVRNPARPGGVAREDQEGGWYHGPI